MASKFNIEKFDLHCPSTIAYVKAYRNLPDYQNLFSSNNLSFLSYAAHKWNTKLGSVCSMLITGVSFCTLSNAEVLDPSGHKLSLSTYLLSPAPPGAGKTAAYLRCIQDPFLELESEWVDEQGKSTVSLVEHTSKAGLISRIGKKNINGRVLWAKDEMSHHLVTMLGDSKNADTVTFRSMLNTLYSCRTFRRDVCKKALSVDDIHFCIGGTAHPEQCLILANMLISNNDGLADRLYIYAAKGSREVELKMVDSDVDSYKASYDEICDTDWLKKIYGMIYAQHKESPYLYRLTPEAANVVITIKRNTMDETDRAYRHIEDVLDEIEAGEIENGSGCMGLAKNIPQNCDSKDVDMILKCTVIFKLLELGIDAVLSGSARIVVDPTITVSDLLKGWSFVSVLRHHTNVFINEARSLALAEKEESGAPVANWRGKHFLSGVLHGDRINKGIILYPGRWMSTTHVSRLYRTGTATTSASSIYKAFLELNKNFGEPGFVGKMYQPNFRRSFFYKAPYSVCDKDYLRNEFGVDENMYVSLWNMDRDSRRVGVSIRGWTELENAMKSNVPKECLDESNPHSDVEDVENSCSSFFQSSGPGVIGNVRVSPLKRTRTGCDLNSFSESPSKSKKL